MSVDYFLLSKSGRRCVMVGSTGLSGIQSWPGTPDVVEFVRWAIEHHIKDVQMLDENELDNWCDEAGLDYVELANGMLAIDASPAIRQQGED